MKLTKNLEVYIEKKILCFFFYKNMENSFSSCTSVAGDGQAISHRRLLSRRQAPVRGQPRRRAVLRASSGDANEEGGVGKTTGAISGCAGVGGEGVDAETLECGGGAWNDDEVGAHVVPPIDANPRGVKKAARNDDNRGASGDHTVTRSEVALQVQELNCRID